MIVVSGIEQQEQWIPLSGIWHDPAEDAARFAADSAAFHAKNPGVKLVLMPHEDVGHVPPIAPPMEFEYPPMPENRGFNIFGPIKDLKLLSAKGSVRVKGAEASFGGFDSPPFELDLHDIKRHAVTNGASYSTPFALKIEERTPKSLDIQGEAQLSVDGRPAFCRATKYGITNSSILFACSVFQGIAALVGLLPYLLRRRSHLPPNQ